MGDVREELNRLADRLDHLDGHDAEERDEIESIMRDLRSLAARGAVPDGFLLVPREPTEEMIEAYHSVEAVTASSDEDADDKWAVESWCAMIAAAPQPAGEVDERAWSLTMAAAEAGQYVGAGAHGIADEPAAPQPRNPNLCPSCKTWPVDGDVCPRCGRAKPFGSVAPQPAGDWPEDATHENGNYRCACVICGQTFVGHKRRVVCKSCSAEPAPSAPAEET